MKEMLQKLREASVAAILQADDITALENLRVKYLGKKGELTAILKQMGRLSAEERPAMGQLANQVRAELEEALDQRRETLNARMLEMRLKAETLDVTMPGKAPELGALPYFLSGLFKKVISSQMLIAFIEGVIRLAIFLGYIAIISLTPDIKRTFMYHGSEHKCINCIEHGLPLTVENVRKSSKHHKRCGTSFLLIVMLISILFFMFIRVDSKPLQLLLRLVLIPVIAGVSYEFIRLAGRYDNPVVNMLSVPGLLMQRMTTKEPDDEMIEVGIASVEAVFDWKKWQEENNVCAH